MISRFEDLVVNKWGARFMGQRFPCSIGRGGIGKKQGEGDGITPIGEFQICAARYRIDRLFHASNGYKSQKIGPQDVWSDDPADPAYNHQASSLDYQFSHEKLFRSDGLYDLLAILNFNYPLACAGAGSAIFIHSWRKPRHPTEGCIAFDPVVLDWILTRWTPRSKVVIKG